MGLILAALVGVAILAIPSSPIHRKVTLGLDLQGGLEVVKKAVPEKGQTVDEEGMDDAVSIIRSRIDSVGAFEPEIRKQGSDQIVIELPGVRDQARATELIGQTAKLELYDLQGDLVPGASLDTSGNPIAHDNLFDLLVSEQQKAKNGQPTSYYLLKETKKGKQTEHKLVVGPKPTREAILASPKGHRAKGKELPKGTKIFAVPEKMVVVTCGETAQYCPGVQPEELDRTYYYLFNYDPQNEEKTIPEMTGDDLERKGTRQDFDSSQGGGNQPVVTMQFTNSGADKFENVTRTLAERGRSLANRAGVTDKRENDAFNQQFAIVLDREIKSAPTVDFDDNPSGIGGNNGAIITGVSIQEAKDLALVLRSGTLPFKLVTIEQTNISATLGKDSLQEAKRAAIGGLLVVALFLLIFYRFLGVVAVFGLGIYAALLYGVVLLLNKQVTMTLPGFAGLILTIGVAADANVVVFERIKEEVRAGKSVRAAISAGYSKGFHTIIDANVVTAITALVLFLVATAGVKGFALMLLIGTAMSLVTAVFATRAMLGLLAGFRWFDSPRFMGAAGQQGAKWLQIDFVGRRRVWFAFSCVVVAISIGALAVRGLNLGIDFKGGTQVNFNTPQSQPVEQVRNDARSIDSSLANAQIVGRGPSTNGEYKSFQIRTESLSPALGTKLRKGLESDLQASSYGSKNVSESFGRQIARSAILAIIFSLVLIVLYLAIRFDLKYALPVIVALIHDVVITVGVYALTGREVSTSTVAAVLTVLGYSIYDTIIIFDRIRENVPLMRRSSFATIANVSLWETVRRSLATTFITLLPVASLLLFGGDTLKDFAFALLVGIGFGAYSSIFIAAPLLTTLKEREPEWARKIGQEDVVEKGIGEGPDEPDDGTPARRPPRAPVGGPAVDTGTMVLEEATQAAAAEPAPALADGLLPEPAPASSASAQSKREKRRQRRRAKPHGRPR
jgi:SecD/SecF fusion protein